MVRPNQDRIGGQPKNHVEVDEWVGGRTRGEGRGVHHKVLVSCHRGASSKAGHQGDNRKDGRYAGRVRLAVVLDRSAESLCGFVESTVAPGSLIVTAIGAAMLASVSAAMSTSLLPSVVIQRLPSNTCRSSIWVSPT